MARAAGSLAVACVVEANDGWREARRKWFRARWRWAAPGGC